MLISGWEQLWQECVDVRMCRRLGALGALLRSLVVVGNMSRMLTPMILIRSVYTVLVLEVVGKLWPRLTRGFLEVLFDRSFQGLPLALEAEARHQFAEPGEPLATLEHRTERVEQARERTMAAVKEALERLLMWARREHSEYLSRVVYWETRPPTQPQAAQPHPEPVDMDDLPMVVDPEYPTWEGCGDDTDGQYVQENALR